MKWLLIYLICAIATAILGFWQVKGENGDFFERYGVNGVLSTLIIGAVFPLTWLGVAIATVRIAFWEWRIRRKWK